MTSSQELSYLGSLIYKFVYFVSQHITGNVPIICRTFLIECWIGIVQPFKLGGESRLIWSAIINRMPEKFFLNFDDINSQEDHKTIFSGLRIAGMALSNQSDFKLFFLAPASHLIWFCKSCEMALTLTEMVVTKSWSQMVRGFADDRSTQIFSNWIENQFCTSTRLSRLQPLLWWHYIHSPTILEGGLPRMT